MSGALMAWLPAPIPTATTDSPMARMMNPACRSVQWAGLWIRHDPCREVR